MEAHLNGGRVLIVPQGAIRAAQYVRMSTDQQRYSIANQIRVNRAYADRRGMVIVRTYADEGKSGLNIERRDALKQLIQDAVSGNADFGTILVYDVSRWGRFQDADESAHYEFICRQAGIRVEYCAEQFDNDGTAVSTILKAVKRLMAGEYSRELSVKIFTAQSHAVAMGFRLGGHAGYGLRRLLVDHTRAAKCILGSGDWKSIASDHVILVPGPPEEVEIVRRIFSMFVHGRLSEACIAKALNAADIVTDRGTRWCSHTIGYILRSEKYIGNNVWNRRSFRLKKTRVRNSPDAWLRAEGAFEAVVDRSLFDGAQAIFRARRHLTSTGRPRGLSNEQMLDALRRLFEQHGHLSHRLINQTRGIPSSSVYAARFGSAQKAYEKVGYDCRDYSFSLAARRFSDVEMLSRLRRLLDERGYLSSRIINGAKGLPNAYSYRRRFGSLFKAYKLIGYAAKCNKHPDRPRGISDEDMLDALARLHKERGRLSQDMISDCDYVPSPDAYAKRFGSLMDAYRLIGLKGDRYAMHCPRPRGLSTKKMLKGLRDLLREHGYLSLKMVEDSKLLPSLYQYEVRFGGLMRAYELIGYKPQSCARGGAATRGKKRCTRRTRPAKQLLQSVRKTGQKQA